MIPVAEVTEVTGLHMRPRALTYAPAGFAIKTSDFSYQEGKNTRMLRPVTSVTSSTITRVKTTASDLCSRCSARITWADQRRQWGRLIRAGLSERQARDIQPRCQKCVTIHLAELRELSAGWLGGR
jgi:hypothetical protein